MLPANGLVAAGLASIPRDAHAVTMGNMRAQLMWALGFIIT